MNIYLFYFVSLPTDTISSLTYLFALLCHTKFFYLFFHNKQVVCKPWYSDVYIIASFPPDDSGDNTRVILVPDWMTVGESVQQRLTSSTGIVAYIGPTHFAGGPWVGVELDAPTGK